jgi:photosystem II stability/assembly factor-like uncharacterized protein
VETAGSVPSVPSSSGKLSSRADEQAPVSKAKLPSPDKKSDQKNEADIASNQLQAKAPLAYSVIVGGSVAQKSALKKAAAPRWNLTKGILRRSFDGGATWENVPQPANPVLSFGAVEAEVWAGGQAGTLFHSVDYGMTWTRLRPAAADAALSGDVVAIELRSATEIIVSTSNKESWTSLNGGETWTKK